MSGKRAGAPRPVGGAKRPRGAAEQGPACFLAVDVGSASARAGFVCADSGEVLGTGSRPLAVHQPGPGLVHQRSADVWAAVCRAARLAAASAGPGVAERCRGVGFDATCSLVVADAKGEGLSVVPPSCPAAAEAWDIMRWDDHRAVQQAERINRGGHAVLRSVGGRISPEMETPKLLWLKENMPGEWWARAAHFFDLPDWLTWRATGQATRSRCSLVCKWTYDAQVAEGGWSRDYLEGIGLGDLCADDFRRIGTYVRDLGEAVGTLTAAAAAELGVPAGCAVATSLIDAHAGGVACAAAGGEDPERTLVVVAGTSACFMASCKERIEVAGVWGPYRSAMLPGYWLHEGGQSCVGALCDHLVRNHPAYAAAQAAAGAQQSVFAYLAEVLERDACTAGVPPLELVRDLHVVPDFHGNRSPIADADMRGAVLGLTLDTSLSALARLYYAAQLALASGVRHVVDSLQDAGLRIERLVVTGGLAADGRYVQALADVTRLPCALPRAAGGDAMLVGGALMASVAAGCSPSVAAAQRQMTHIESTVRPDATQSREVARRYRVFRQMLLDQKRYREMMRSDAL